MVLLFWKVVIFTNWLETGSYGKTEFNEKLICDKTLPIKMNLIIVSKINPVQFWLCQ